MRVHRILLLLTITLLALPALACGKEGASSEVNSDSDLHRVFALMPDRDVSRRYVSVVNIPNSAAFVAVQIPVDEPQADEADEWKLQMLMSLIETTPNFGAYLAWMPDDQWLSGLQRTHALMSSENTRVALGFDTRHLKLVAVTGNLESGNSPVIELVIGDVSASEAAAALAACTQCPLHETVQVGNVDYYSWGEDFKQSLENRLAPPAFDQLGRGGRVRVADGHAYRTARTIDMEAAIEAETGAGPSLLDDADWQLAADALSQYDFMLVTASDENVDLVDNPWRYPITQAPRENVENAGPGMVEWLDSYPERAATAIAASPGLPNHSLAVTGLVGGEQGLEVVMALVFEDEETAGQAADALRQRAEAGLRDAREEGLTPWSDYIIEAEFATDGRAVIGRVVPSNDEDDRSHYPLFMVLPVPGVQFTGGSQPPFGPTAEFLLQ